jgi:hypothetical protein
MKITLNLVTFALLVWKLSSDTTATILSRVFWEYQKQGKGPHSL